MLLAALAAALVLVGGVEAARRALAPPLDASGPAQRALLGRRQAGRLAVVVAGDARRVRWQIDGRDATRQARVEGDRLVLRPRLGDGAHVVRVESRAGFLGARSVRRFAFSVDTKPPAIRLASKATARAFEPLSLRGTTEDGATLTADGSAVLLDHGAFAVRRTPPLPQKLVLRAVDAAGNRSERRVAVSLVPRRPSVPVRAIHVTFYAWADDTLRAGVLRLIAQHRVNAVELDLKDESGIVGFRAGIPLARRIGAEQNIYDLRKAVVELHAKGVRVIGRLVCFRDPILANAAWKSGARDEVIQTPSHTPYAGYGGFTNFANETVRRYNIDVAVAAARAGVDDVLYDYVRRPDGPPSTMIFPGLRGSPEDGIVEFLRESRTALRPFGTYIGASVFGVAATRPEEVAQPIRRMARSLDYVAPMVYPSHWGPGEYRVANPNAEPYAIVQRSLRDFSRDVAGSGARVVPWLQDFSLGITYGPREVRAQIDAAKRDGIGDYLLWDPSVTYTSDALTPDAPMAHSGLARASARKAAVPPSTKPAVKTRPERHGVQRVKTAAGRAPNELGVVPVLMHHEIRPDRVGDYDQTPAEFRAELARLWRAGYWPVTAADLVERRLDRVPAGKTPVVLTFDDSTRYQLFFRGGKVVPDTAVGIMLAFARSHPGFEPAGTFYVLREPFGGVPEGATWLRWLVRHGFELGNHSKDHLPLRTLSDTDVQKELALGRRILTDAVPGYRVRTMALPLGSMPHRELLALHGRWHGIAYAQQGVFLVGANPAPSPYARSFDPLQIPRIRSSHAGWAGAKDFAASYWLHELDVHPEQRYVSDGDPARVSVRRADEGLLAPRFRTLERRG